MPPPFASDRITTLTFDCYGTLIDWEAGAIAALRPVLARHDVQLSEDDVVALFHRIDAALCEPPFRPYREVLAQAVDRIGHHLGFAVTAEERTVLVRSVPTWRPFPDTVEALRALGRRFRLALISNVDDDLLAGSLTQLGVPFEPVVTSEQARSYKPDLPIFHEAARRLQAAPGSVVHVAEGTTEIGPARSLGWGTVWVRRNGRSRPYLTEAPDLEAADLRSLLAAMGVAA